MRDMFNDFWLQVRAKFTLSDDMRELFSTVTRGWLIWQAILVLTFLVSCAFSLSEGKWYQGFLEFMIAAFFVLTAFYEMILNVTKKTIDNLFGVAHDQQKTMYQMMAVIEGTTPTGEFD